MLTVPKGAWDTCGNPDYTCTLGPDYMANFSPASETSPLKIKIKLTITWRGIQPGLKILARYIQTGLGFSARPNGQKSHIIATNGQPG